MPLLGLIKNEPNQRAKAVMAWTRWLNGTIPIPSTMQAMNEPVIRGALTTQLRVTHSEGLTLHMAGEIAQALQSLDVEVALEHRGVVANARSILAVVCLAAACRDRVCVWANGPDAKRALEILVKAFAGGFGTKEGSA